MPSDPPRQDDVDDLDWDALRDRARRRLRARLSGFGATDLEDAVQDVAQRVVEFVRRHGRPDSLDALLLHLVRAVAADAIRRRQRDRAVQTGEVATWLDEPSVDGHEEEVLEEYRVIVFHVREYLRLRRAGCVPIADAKSRGESLKEFAARERTSYDMVRQAWSRCVKLIHDAMRRRRLRLPWLTPRRRRASGD